MRDRSKQDNPISVSEYEQKCRIAREEERRQFMTGELNSQANMAGYGSALGHGEAMTQDYSGREYQTDMACEKIQGAGALNPLEQAHETLKAEDHHSKLREQQMIQLSMVMPSTRANLSQLAQGMFQWFKHQGFWPANWYSHGLKPSQITIPYDEYVRLKKMEKLGLIVTEVAECMEAVRKNDIENELEELADIDVRMLDYKGGFGFAEAAPQAFEAKMRKNYLRPFRHGKKF